MLRGASNRGSVATRAVDLANRRALDLVVDEHRSPENVRAAICKAPDLAMAGELQAIRLYFDGVLPTLKRWEDEVDLLDVPEVASSGLRVDDDRFRRPPRARGRGGQARARRPTAPGRNRRLRRRSGSPLDR